ncbi:hypothetical protein [Nocardioides sp. B-3]|uniref:hypothetical protein n=1 Tax=Nocardioides sp. B-3 TaxID=2895565 RepID=UPI0021531362|nr:hypothetical protein [Nocardioides sp. B-3]UUZ61516.1 hypothetical protein LP418_13725 [Nocardioides sp. B-3]
MTANNAAAVEAGIKPTSSFMPGVGAGWAYATLALGSALALFMYPHSITASLSSNSRNTIRRNAAILPAYSFVLGLLALLGWVAIAAGTTPIGLDGEPNAQLVIPQLFEDMFPAWFAGVASGRDRDRRARAGGDHVDRGGQHLQPQHLQGVAQQERHPRSGGEGLQADVAGREGVRPGSSC